MWVLHSNSGRDMQVDIDNIKGEENKKRGKRISICNEKSYRDVDSGLLVRERFRFYSILDGF